MYQSTVLVINYILNFNSRREIYDLSGMLLTIQNKKSKEKTIFTKKYYAAMKKEGGRFL